MTRTFLPFVAVKLAGMGINTGMMYVFFNLLSLHEAAAFILATACSLVWNFSVSKFVIFKE
jgi:putative flippase GtrA